jgi:photosystem II stability/assembly factor-like uncharacterized protein
MYKIKVNIHHSKFILSILIMLIIGFNSAFSQPWADEQNGSPKKNFYDIQKAANEFWKDKDVTIKGKGWKPYKRWEWFWEQRVYPSGEFPSPMQNITEKNKFIDKKSGNKIQAVGDWVSLGPTTNGGSYGGLGRVNCVREDPSNSSILWAGAASGGIWKSTNSGSSWTTTTDNLAVLGISDIVFNPTNSSIMYVATGDGDAYDNYSLGVLKSTDGGASWNTTGLVWTEANNASLSRLLINPSNPNILIAGGESGIWRTTDAGVNWSQVYSSSVRDLELMPGNPSIVYAGKYGSPSVPVMKSTDGGATWSDLSGLPTSGVNRTAIGVTPANANYIYALMSQSSGSGFYGLYRSTDAGSTWTLMSSSPNILGLNSDGSSTGGQGWYDLCIDVSQTNANEIYCGGINLWKSTNGGTNWIYLRNFIYPIHVDQHDLWFAPGTNRLYVGNDGGVYRSTYSGNYWSWISSGLAITQFYRIGTSKTNANLVIGGTQDNGTKMISTGTWSDEYGGDGMECIIDHSNANVMYGELYYGAIRKSTDGGSSWSPVTTPSSGAWVTPFIMDATNASLIFVGYENVYKSTNGGSNWTQISSFGGDNLTVLHSAPSNANYIYASTGKTTLQRTTSGGVSWTELGLPSSKTLTYMAIHPTDPLKIWATFSGYDSDQKVYSSTDGGATWTNISGTGQLPNVPVNTIVYQKDYNNRLYIGTDVGVYCKDDNSGGWVDYSTNLPNVIVNELEIQYSSMKLRAGTYGRGLWEAEIPSNNIVLNPPTLLTPTNGSTNVILSPTLTWNSVSGATAYDLQYSTRPNFSNAKTISDITTTYKQISGISKKITYYWRVRAKNTSQTGNYSSAWKFKTSNSGMISAWDEEIEIQAVNLKFYPNPFSNSTHFKLEVFYSEEIKIVVTDIFGRKISTLVNELHKPGIYEFDFDANNLSAGVYFCHLIVGDEIRTLQMVIMK